jgi:hypothetical protein
MNRTRTGLALLALLSLADLTAPLMDGGGDGPPMAVALVASVIGLASLGLLWYVVRGARRAVVPLLALRALSALTAVPAFFAGDVPPCVRPLAAVYIALTGLGIALVAPVRATSVRTEVAR